MTLESCRGKRALMGVWLGHTIYTKKPQEKEKSFYNSG